MGYRITKLKKAFCKAAGISWIDNWFNLTVIDGYLYYKGEETDFNTKEIWE